VGSLDDGSSGFWFWSESIIRFRNSDELIVVALLLAMLEPDVLCSV
jgi:hypothetical protein